MRMNISFAVATLQELALLLLLGVLGAGGLPDANAFGGTRAEESDSAPEEQQEKKENEQEKEQASSLSHTSRAREARAVITHRRRDGARYRTAVSRMEACGGRGHRLPNGLLAPLVR
ncbi:MAG: hypothetical protein VX346_28130 [Planctomycetota bacterium]|nr:hypothetical protein [Planctomycetota bacterium]